MWRNPGNLVCPKCSEPDLWLEPLKDGFRVRCRECGWDSGLVLLADDAVMSDAIADAVAAARVGGSEAR